MRTLKLAGWLLVVVLLVGLFACEVLAERPGAIEIRDKFMWGDPDEPAGCRGVNRWQRSVMRTPDSEMEATELSPWAEVGENEQSLRVSITLLGFEVRQWPCRVCRAGVVRR